MRRLFVIALLALPLSGCIQSMMRRSCERRGGTWTVALRSDGTAFGACEIGANRDCSETWSRGEVCDPTPGATR